MRAHRSFLCSAQFSRGHHVAVAERRNAGFPVHKTTRTPVGVPSTAPRGQLIASDRLEHKVSVADSATPTHKAKPAGVVGCEVFRCIAESAPTDPVAYELIGVWTRSPEKVKFSSEQGGRTAHYLFRWMNTKRRTGPSSGVVSSTIPAV